MSLGDSCPPSSNAFLRGRGYPVQESMNLGSFFAPWAFGGAELRRSRKLAYEMALRQGRFPLSRVEIESLPGVGQYIANAVMLFCHAASEPLLDVNMARILERYFGPRTLADIRYDPYLQHLSRRVLLGTDALSMNWAILDLAALICTARKPRCDECPLSPGCLYRRAALVKAGNRH